jgi:Integrase core domain/gag-polypeptide of LTR copia-type/GAG-pre-integrase domain
MAQTSQRIDPLIGENYFDWRVQMRLFLEERNLWGFVDGEYSSSTKKLPGESFVEFKERMKLSKKAVSTICGALSSSQLDHVKDSLSSAKEVWEALARENQMEGFNSKVIQRHGLYGIELEEGEDIRKNVNNFVGNSKHHGGKLPKRIDRFGTGRVERAAIGLHAACYVGGSNKDTIKIIVDSGATSHMSYQRDWFVSYETLGRPIKVTLADGKVVQAIGQGDLRIVTKVDGEDVVGRLKDVLYLPELSMNLFSVSQATKCGMKVEFDNQFGRVIQKSTGRVTAMPSLEDNLYILIGRRPQPDQTTMEFANAASGESIDLWHQRLGHLGARNVRLLGSSDLVRGIRIKGSHELEFCEGCAKGRSHRQAIMRNDGPGSSEILGLIHSDLCGPMQTPTAGGFRYFITFTDDKTRMKTLYLMKEKSETLQKLKEYEAKVTVETGKRIKAIRSGNGGEYTSREFNDFCKLKGTSRQFTAPYTPEQNGVAERLNRTLMESARCMLKHAEMEDRYWGEAIMTAVYIANRCPTVAVDDVTPYEAFTGNKPSAEHLRVFGCDAFVHVPSEKRKKLDDKAIKCKMVGYCSESKCYRLLVPGTNKIIKSRDVIFNERSIGDKDGTEQLTESPPSVVINGPGVFPAPAIRRRLDDQSDNGRDVDGPEDHESVDIQLEHFATPEGSVMDDDDEESGEENIVVIEREVSESEGHMNQNDQPQLMVEQAVEPVRVENETVGG